MLAGLALGARSPAQARRRSREGRGCSGRRPDHDREETKPTGVRSPCGAASSARRTTTGAGVGGGCSQARRLVSTAPGRHRSGQGERSALGGLGRNPPRGPRPPPAGALRALPETTAGWEAATPARGASAGGPRLARQPRTRTRPARSAGGLCPARPETQPGSAGSGTLAPARTRGRSFPQPPSRARPCAAARAPRSRRFRRQPRRGEHAPPADPPQV